MQHKKLEVFGNMAGEDSVPRVLEVQKFVGARDAEVTGMQPRPQ